MTAIILHVSQMLHIALFSKMPLLTCVYMHSLLIPTLFYSIVINVLVYVPEKWKEMPSLPKQMSTCQHVLNYDEHSVHHVGVSNIILDVKTEYFVGIQIK